ncbi:pilus assembly PilX family protein [Solimonas marina]|uniref:Pilus assembly protein n=1 Tax=Solimonas marina TaxID=2714601 RepID=A0A970B6T7_9GAMM|nr:PilX N-terminal domain-containing pilus assembly protein [Solimonas marina]NKF23168.1 pilus assembly protein [Solimonas marina]
MWGTCPRRPLDRQSGVALVVALILLILVTLIGLAAIRGATTQQKMTANFYDRETAFQSAEAGLEAGAAALAAGAPSYTRNCAQGGSVCQANPFADPNLPSDSIQTVSTGEFEHAANATGQPQFVIENMGNYSDPNSNTGFGQTANAAQYGAQGVTTTAVYYRITARSGDPDEIGERAVVTLQAMYKQ